MAYALGRQALPHIVRIHLVRATTARAVAPKHDAVILAFSHDSNRRRVLSLSRIVEVSGDCPTSSARITNTKNLTC
jgi:hypothetical protein